MYKMLCGCLVFVVVVVVVITRVCAPEVNVRSCDDVAAVELKYCVHSFSSKCEAIQPYWETKRLCCTPLGGETPYPLVYQPKPPVCAVSD